MVNVKLQHYRNCGYRISEEFQAKVQCLYCEQCMHTDI